MKNFRYTPADRRPRFEDLNVGDCFMIDEKGTLHNWEDIILVKTLLHNGFNAQTITLGGDGEQPIEFGDYSIGTNPPVKIIRRITVDAYEE